MSKDVRHRGVQARPRQGQVLHIEDWAERPAAPSELCRECFRLLETEDELETGYCLKDLNKSKTWPREWNYQSDTDNDPLAVAKGMLLTVLIVIAAATGWRGRRLFAWLRQKGE